MALIYDYMKPQYNHRGSKNMCCDYTMDKIEGWLKTLAADYKTPAETVSEKTYTCGTGKENNLICLYRIQNLGQACLTFNPVRNAYDYRHR